MFVFVMDLLIIAVVCLSITVVLHHFYNPSFGELHVNVSNPTDDDIFRLVINDDPNHLVNRRRVVLKVIKD